MTELKYTVTEEDIKSLNKRIMLFYVIAYAVVAAAGIAVGIVAVVLNAQKTMFVLGILLIVMGGALLLCAVALLLAPKNYVKSIVPVGEYDVIIDKSIQITVDGKTETLPFSGVSSVKRRGGNIVLGVGKAGVFIVKSESDELYNELCDKQGKLLISEVLEDGQPNVGASAGDGEKTAEPEQNNEVGESGESGEDA